MLHLKRAWSRFWSIFYISDFNVYDASVRHFYRKPQLHSLSYKQVSELTILWYVKKALKIGLHFACWSKHSCFRPKVKTLGTVYLCLKLNRRYTNHLETDILNLCKQKQGRSLVYMTKSCELCILHITLQLTLKFHLFTKNAFLKHCK
jgi:hypothetical protein